MRNDYEDFLSRKEKHEEAITKLLSDDSRESTTLILYTGEIPFLERKYPVNITKGAPYEKNNRDLKLFYYTVSKQ